MKLFPFLALALFTTPLLHAEEKELFNGKDLTGWDGNTELWSVKDGAITGQTTPEHPAKGNTFLIWKGGDVSDFEMTFQYKIVDKDGGAKGFGNSGVQYRSRIVDAANWVVGGYQADFEVGKTYSGILYEERTRGILAQRGQKVTITNVEKSADNAKAKPFKIEVTGEVGKSEEIQAAIKPADWNEYRIVAKGGHLQHFINGKQTVDVTDETKEGAKTGILALQLHAGAPMMVQFKDLKLKELK